MCALVTGVQTCALPICQGEAKRPAWIPIIVSSVAVAAPDGSSAPTGLPVTPSKVSERKLIDMPASGALDTMTCAERSPGLRRSEEHTSELQSLMRISYAVFCLKKKNNKHKDNINN